MLSSKRLNEIAHSIGLDVDPITPYARPMSPVPSSYIKDELSALCSQLFEGTDGISALGGILPQSPRLSANSTVVTDVVSKHESDGSDDADAAALDIFNFLEQKEKERESGEAGAECEEIDEFDETKIFEPKQHHLDCFRKTVREESRKWMDAHAVEKTKARLYDRSPMQVLWDRERNHRGCARGACCVYSMWYDPKFGGHGDCTHKCTVSHGVIARCGPSLFALDLPPLDYPGDFGGNPGGTVERAPPTYNIARKSNRRILSKLRKASHSGQQTSLPSNETCDDNRLAVVAEAAPEKGKRGTKRNRKNLSAVSRIRKRLGQRSFGKLKNGPKVLPELSCVVAANHSGHRPPPVGQLLLGYEKQ